MKQLLSLLSLMLFVAVGTPTYAQGDKPSSDEIWYTTTDGNIVYPNSGALGSNILSNTYRNGKGVILVEGDCINRIGESAFSGCSSLTSIAIPDSVTSIGESAFEGCSSLTSVYITDIAAWCRISFANNWANPLCFAHNLYLNGELVTDLTIPDSVTSIEWGAFWGCSSLTSVTIPDSVTEIGIYAFYGCTSLRSISIPDSVTSIGDYAFYGCRSLTSITIPDSVTSIGTLVFYNCSSLTNFYGKFASEDGRCLIIDGVLNYFAPAGLSEYTIPDGVTSIEYAAFSGCSSLTSVTIPDSVTSIGNYAFNVCTSLRSISIPDSVTSIGDWAFRGCTSLTSITIPDGVTSIGKEAFSGCIKLEQVYLSSLIPPALRENAFSGNAQNLLIYIPKEAYKSYLSMESWKPYSNLLERYQPEGAQASATSTARQIWYTTTDGNIVNPKPGALGSKIIYNEYFNGKGVMLVEGDYIEKIGEEAFSGCSSLTSITIPDSVTEIGDGAFRGCPNLNSFAGKFATADGRCLIANGKLIATIPSGLTQYSIPDSVTSIGDYAFENCSSMTSITIPDSITSIGEGAFSGCSSLTSVHITDIAAWCRISFSDTWANPICFAHNLYLNGELVTDLIIPDSVTSIGGAAFCACTSLTSITIPDSVTSIGTLAFEYCSSLTSVTMGNGVTSIGQYAFRVCRSLRSITIPNSVTSIGGAAFNSCTSLTSVTIGNGVTSIGDYAFYECSSLRSITIPDSVTEIGESVFEYCYWLRDTYVNITDLAAYATGNTTSLFPGKKHLMIDDTEITKLVIPDSVTSIGENAFEYCYSLTSITIPDSVTSIGSGAFSDCRSLTSVTIPNSVTSIGERAFYCCRSLTRVTIGNGVTSIGESAFYCCSSLTSVTIGNGVTSIGAYAFSDCDWLTSITIPDSVISIGDSAFGHCDSLEKVYCKPTTPPSYGDYVFYNNAYGRKIYVPRGSVNAYKNAGYTSSIVGYDFK